MFNISRSNCIIISYNLTFQRMRNKCKIINVQRNGNTYINMSRVVCYLSCDNYCEEFLKMSFNAIKYNFFL